MRRLLRLLVPLALAVAACGDDDAGDGAADTTTVPDTAAAETTTTAPDDTTTVSDDTSPTTVPTDAPAGGAPEGAGTDEGRGDALLVADLGPDAVVPGPGAAGAAGRFEAELVEGVLCVDAVARDLRGAVTGAHVHEGAAGEAGPVLVDLGPPATDDGAGARWSDACTEVSDEVIERLAAAPERHHVDVHTEERPEGAVRGQLAVASVFDRTLG